MDGCHIGSDGEGKSDENPIGLGGITEFEMTSFLDALETRFVSGDPKLEFGQWTAALHLATMWNFEDLRKDIIAHVNKTISDANPVDRVDASLKCRVEEWLHPAYQALCERKTGLTNEEAERLGLARLLRSTEFDILPNAVQQEVRRRGSTAYRPHDDERMKRLACMQF
ncbi:hypothetical protein FRC01_006182 [Tulasnella sp. 417]|nr:hypothetical protein FRC01_006182 [Tulasnella sp. 417]